MRACNLCKSRAKPVSGALGVCLECVRDKPARALKLAERAHIESRQRFGLPARPPSDPEGIRCRLCCNSCQIPSDQIGYCGLRKNVDGALEGVTARSGKLSWYHDPLPTNCVADRFCPGGTGTGYPQYASCNGPEIGCKNLAVFFHACSFNCLYCQNWHFRQETLHSKLIPVERLVSSVDDKTTCICYFGGDPSPQIPFSLRAARMARDNRPEGILRICWETNGSMHPDLLDKMMILALSSGGCIKFDLKAYDDTLHRALTGISNKRTLENFRQAAGMINQRPVPPPLVASTLLVSGYIDHREIRAIAELIARLDPQIPYNLLAFHPQFLMDDLPTTSREQAYRCLAEARKAGLQNVRLGNIHLLH